MNNKGYSYVEIIVCLTIIVINSYVIFLILNLSVRNLNYAINNYEINLLGDSIMNESYNILSKNTVIKYLEEMKEKSLNEFLGINKEEFKFRYKSDKFKYVLKIDNYIFKSSSCNSELNKKICNENIVYNYYEADELVIFEDEQFKIINTMGYLKILENKIIIKIPENVDYDKFVYLDFKNIIDKKIDLYIENKSKKFLTVIINKKFEMDESNICFKSKNNDGLKNILLKILDKDDNNVKLFQMYIEVYDSMNTFLKRFSKPIILYW